MDKRVKIAIAASAAVMAVTTGGLLAYFQPWKKDEAPTVPPQSQQENENPSKKEEKPEELYVTVSGEKLPCTLYESDGWSILLPEGWTADSGILWPNKTKAPDAWLRVTADGEDHGMEFTSLWERDGVRGYTLSVGNTDPCEIIYQSKTEDYPTYNQIFREVAKTFKKNNMQPFASLIGSHEPDLHMDNGSTILFMDKLGVSVDEYADKAVKNHMISWPKEEKNSYTGTHRVEKPIVWEASYTANERYIEVFSCEAAYELSKDSKVTDADVKEGWRHEKFYLVLAHQGDGIKESYALWGTQELPGFSAFLNETLSTIALP